VSVVKKLKLFFELSKHHNYFFLMPNGLYSDENKKIQGSEILTQNLLTQFSIGDTLFLETLNIHDLIKKIFSLSICNKFVIAKNVFYYRKQGLGLSEIKIEDAFEIIQKFSEVHKKTVYEKFLEFMILVVFLESLKNSKVMLGGVWNSRALKGEKGKTGYEIFVQNLNTKNTLVEKLKPLLNNYRNYDLLEMGLLEIKTYRAYLSEYAIYLEYIYLHILLKNTIQKLYLMLGYANEIEKKSLKNKIDNIKRLMQKYEQVNRE